MMGVNKAVLATLATTATAVQYEQYILAPTSRTIHPSSVYQVNGSVVSAESLTGSASDGATFNDVSSVTLDFGKNIAGLVTLTVGEADEDQYIGLTYTESSLWISGEGSDGTADAGLDEILWFAPAGPGEYSVSREHERGGFRYLSLIHNTTGSIEVQAVTVQFTAMPHWEDHALRDYTGWFHSTDELLNRIWYAGAYTNQLCTIDPTHGDALRHLGEITSAMLGNETGPNTWYNNFTVSNGSSALVDGAKRDRIVWAGDMSIAVPSVVVSTNDLITMANSLDSLFNIQNKTSGLLPYAGTPFPSAVSFTYHLYTLIGVADYYTYSGSLEYLQGKWDNWKLALSWSLSHIDSTGLMNVTSPNDWLRFGMGGHNIEANAILYYTINQGITLGRALNESSSLLSKWTATASRIKIAANDLLWDSTAWLYKDNETTTLHPQDGNSWAIVANLTTSSTQNTQISQALSARWGPYGAPALEADNAVSPFISGFELQAHLIANNVSAALQLMRLQWGDFMLNDPRMTNSTFIEGYASDGSLHYAPYTNDPRVSHAHGWATGPTSTLTFYIGGIHLTGPSGQTWEFAPRIGDLESVDTGFETSLGSFYSKLNASNGIVTAFEFGAPAGTKGSVSLPGISGYLSSANGTSLPLSGGVAIDVPGGLWTLAVSGVNSTNGTINGTWSAPPQQVGNDGSRLSGTSMVGFAIAAALWILQL